MSTLRALVELTRAPAGLTVLGDPVAGAAAAGKPLRGRRFLLPAASVAFYWAGMVLNDWADRSVDAVERPERPIPSGRISPGAALAVAAGLGAAGVGLSGVANGGRGMPRAAGLAAAVWAYDTRLSGTQAGPAGMAACRVLDVLQGAPQGRVRRALPAALAVGVHTVGVTQLSTGEVRGGSRRSAYAALSTTAAAATLALSRPAGEASASGISSALAPLSWYVAGVGKAQLAAARNPSAAQVRAATVAGIHGMVPLQAGIGARHGASRAAVALTTVLPLARRLARKVSPT